MEYHRYHPTRVRRRSSRDRRSFDSPVLSILFFPAAILYHELLLRLFDGDSPFFTLALLRILLFSAAAGLLIFLVLDLIPARRASLVAGGVLLLAGTVLVCIERGCRSMFGVYFGPTTIGGMAGNVMGSFLSTVFSVFVSILPFILLSLVPLGLYVWLGPSVFREEGQEGAVRIMLAVMLVACQLVGFLLSTLGGARNYYTYDFTANNGIPNFGVLTTIRLELEYSVFGIPEADLGSYKESAPPAFSTAPSADPGPSADPAASQTPAVSQDPAASETPSAPVEYGYNVLDIDFEALAAASSGTVQQMHEYFGSLTPSQQNQYTGMFKGKNLIFLTAEAFSPYFISEDLTPTLYRLTHEGFVFNNYYQPDWTMSTCGGEFANTTGIIPNWVPEGIVTNGIVGHFMPLTLAHQFAKLGYSVPAWHDHTYTYYDRDKYLSTFGYDYHGIGNGLELPNSSWPNSDLEMMQATVDSYIDDYVNNGRPFHAYYMTVSGHALYNFGGQAMAKKNRETAQAAYPNASEPVQAYIACNLELEYAMEYLVDKLEAAGIADDTLIVLGADHYPYALTQNQPEDYYNELRGVEDTELVTSRYKNALIMWSAAITEPVIVDTPCYSCDILPTISNLFGLEYDSRLFSGRDIFAANYEPDQYSNCMPLVVFANNKGQGNSWITAAGTYEASTGTFTPNEGITVADDYVSRVNNLVAGKIQYAKLIVTQDYYKSVFG